MLSERWFQNNIDLYVIHDYGKWFDLVGDAQNVLTTNSARFWT